MKCKTTVLAWIVISLLAGEPAAQAAPQPAPAPARQPAVLAGGTASGSWNLPDVATGSDGFAAGLLRLGASAPFYLLDAVLPASSVQVVGDHLEGQLIGVLHSFPLSPIGSGFPLVTGTWRTSGPAGGSFSAALHTAGGPQGVPTILLGVLDGTFEDLTVPGGPEFLGSFSGSWMLTPPTG